MTYAPAGTPRDVVEKLNQEVQRAVQLPESQKRLIAAGKPAKLALTAVMRRRPEAYHARLLAHELYHVLAQTGEHAVEGIAKARFSRADLMAEHFEFEAITLDKLRPRPAVRGGAEMAANSRHRLEHISRNLPEAAAFTGLGACPAQPLGRRDRLNDHLCRRLASSSPRALDARFAPLALAVPPTNSLAGTA
jgi:hypothetical protein